MRINVLQHTPNEGPGAIRLWAEENGHELYVYHPYRYGILPDVEETDMLVILGGPMSPNDDFEWLKKEAPHLLEFQNNPDANGAR